MHTVVHLVRHGITSWNEQKRLQGWTDIELNDAGFNQAQKIASMLQSHTIHAVYASTLTRAIQTAQVIAAHHQLSVVSINDLKEGSFGVLEGLTWEEASAHPEFKTQVDHDRYVAKSPGGESMEEVESRAGSALDSIVENHPNQSIVVVSHGLVLKTLAVHMGVLDRRHIEKVFIENGSIFTVEFSHRTKSYNVIDFPARWSSTIL